MWLCVEASWQQPLNAEPHNVFLPQLELFGCVPPSSTSAVWMADGDKVNTSGAAWQRDTEIFWQNISAGCTAGCSTSALRGEGRIHCSPAPICPLLTHMWRSPECVCWTEMTVLREDGNSCSFPYVHNVPAVNHVERNVLTKTNYISQRAGSTFLPSAQHSHLSVISWSCLIVGLQ